MKVTFIGIGAIGLPMALRIQGAGHDVTGVDVSASVVTTAKASGVETVTGSPMRRPQTSWSSWSRRRISWQASSKGPPKLSPMGHRLPARAVVADHVAPSGRSRCASRASPAACRRPVVDAPVTGALRERRPPIGHLRRGCAGDVSAAMPMLEAMGTVRVTGKRLGDGQSIKVVNQHLCSIHIVAAAEALSLARSLGLDPAAVLALIENGAAGSWMLSDRGPRMVAGTDVEVTSAINIFVKDSGLVLSGRRGLRRASFRCSRSRMNASAGRRRQASVSGMTAG